MMLQIVTFQPLVIELLVHALKEAIIAESAKHACKRHTVSVEKSLYLLVNSTWFHLIIIQLKYNTNLKIYNTKVD